MTLVDVLILAVVAMAVAHGVLVGAAVQTLSLGGFWLGLTAGAAVAPLVAGVVAEPLAKALVTLTALFGMAVIASAIGREVGLRIWGGLRRARLGWVDSGLGALLAGVATLLAGWLLASTLATAPLPGLATSIQDSALVGLLDEMLPPAPSVFSRVQRLIEARGLPQVFAQLEPRPAEPLPSPPAAVARAALEVAGPSTVRIEGTGCGGIQTGSGFVAAPGLVVTNAHVVSGIARPLVIDRLGRHAATPVLFDPALDIAVLRADGLAGEPLPMSAENLERGAVGAVLGHPGGGRLVAAPAVVLDRLSAVGRDIYGRALVRRQVYQLGTRVRPGNSGGPLVDADGTVVGVIFSRSSREPDIGYAVTSVEVRTRLEAARRRGARVGTGPCAA